MLLLLKIKMLKLKAIFTPIAESNEGSNAELIGSHRKSAKEIGGYYQPNPELTSKTMRKCNI
jgi:isocitrate dehydrogenase